MKPAFVLVVNAGSSSLKFALVEPVSGNVGKHGIVERLGGGQARLAVSGAPARDLDRGLDHTGALELVLNELGGETIGAVGHRVVHGGEAFAESVLLDAAVIEQIRRCAELAPLHNPANLRGIEAARRHFPDVAHVAVFDTAFHQTLPPRAYLYAVPYDLYRERKVRRYGFHGTSHHYVASEAAARLGRPLQELELLTAHLGNGCSAAAVRRGRSLDTTMGFTPLEGLVMGTRSGDIDPNLHQFLVEHTGRSLEEVTDMLNRRSGLLGISGTSNDMRALEAAAARGDERAELAIEVFCYRLAKGLLGLCAALERVDALVFTGGIGENSAGVRARTLESLRVLGPELEPELNARHGAEGDGRITRAASRLLALVVPTNEELVIARETARLAQR